MIRLLRKLDVYTLRFFLFLAAVFSALTATVAHADVLPPAPAVPGAPTGPAWVTALVQYCLVPLIPVLGTLTAAVLAKGALYLHAKEGNSKVAGAFAIGLDYFTTAFTHIRAGIEPDLKLALADGTLDANERAALVAKLVALAKAELPGSVMGLLSKALGAGLETWLNGKAGDAVQAVVAAKAAPGELAVASPQ